MTNRLFRVFNEEEDINVKYNSYDDMSSRKRTIEELYEQIETICELSQKCGIKISSALRIASQYPWVLTDIQRRVRDLENTIPLDLFLVFDENKSNIPMQPLVDFIVKYNSTYQETGKYLDEDRGDGQYFWEVIWEIVRRKEFPKAPSRQKCCFAFSDLGETRKFAFEIRSTHSQLAEVEILDANVYEYDMQWVTEVPIDSTMGEAIEYARKYWNKELTAHPIMEVLIQGDYILKKICDD